MEIKEHKRLASIGIVISVILVIGLGLSIYSERRISWIHAVKEYRPDVLEDLPVAFCTALTVGPFAFFTPEDSGSTPSLHARALLFRGGVFGWAGLGLIIYFVTRGGYYRNCGILAGTGFLILSMADAVEMLSGSWKTPAWSFGIRCADIAAMVLLCI